MSSHHNELTALLARIDQELALTETIGNDISLDMQELFKICDAREGLKLARDSIESMLGGKSSDDVEGKLNEP
jgi:hypothetical protein